MKDKLKGLKQRYCCAVGGVLADRLYPTVKPICSDGIALFQENRVTKHKGLQNGLIDMKID